VRIFRRSLIAVAALVAASAATAPPASARTLPLPAFDSCAAVRAALPFAPDGTYRIRTDRHLLAVHCHDMAGDPREYLALAATGPDDNFSQYTAGGSSPGTDVRTSFSRIRIDPATLVVDVNDLTFATSSGLLRHGGQDVTSMPYAVAMSCAGTPDGVAGVDLRGTAFTLADTFVLGGFVPVGAATVSATGREADLTGGGHCGWTSSAPFSYNPFNPQGSDFRLELACAPVGLVDLLRNRICVDLT
jgi:hypothetical protein